MMSMAFCWCSLYQLSTISYESKMNWSTLKRWKTLSMFLGHRSNTTSLVTLLTTLSLGTKCCIRAMIISDDCIDTRCDVAFTNIKWINEDTSIDVLVGLLKILRNSPKSVCPRSVSLFSADHHGILTLREFLGIWKLQVWVLLHMWMSFDHLHVIGKNACQVNDKTK